MVIINNHQKPACADSECKMHVPMYTRRIITTIIIMHGHGKFVVFVVITLQYNNYLWFKVHLVVAMEHEASLKGEMHTQLQCQ